MRNALTLRDVSVDVTGKLLIGLGLGALLAQWLMPYAWALVALGVIMSGIVKVKYWRIFWR